MRCRTKRKVEALEQRFRALGWEWNVTSKSDYEVDFPMREFSEEEFLLFDDMFRVAIGEEIESESAPSDERVVQSP